MTTHLCRFCGKPVNPTEDEKEQMRQAWRDGTGVSEIARIHHVTRRTVYKALESVRFPEEQGQGDLLPEED